MKANLPKNPVENGRNYGDSKELVESYQVVAVKNGEFHTPVTCRLYMGRSSSASTVYCSLWFNGKGNWYSGKGSAGGGGYHKASAAVQDALTSAGVTLVADKNGDQYGSPRSGESVDIGRGCHIGGCGDRSIEYALEALARALGFRKFTIVR